MKQLPGAGIDRGTIGGLTIRALAIAAMLAPLAQARAAGAFSMSTHSVRAPDGTIAAAASGVATDRAGNVYVLTTSMLHGHQAIVVTSYARTGAAPRYSVALGKDCDSSAAALAVDAAGAAYVTGTYGAKDSYGFCTVRQAEVARITPGGSVAYSVQFGKQGQNVADYGNGIAVDSAGNAYVTGETDFDLGFPTTPGAFQQNTGTGTGRDTAFVLKIDRAGKLVYGTLLGGANGNGDRGYAIAVDGKGDAYVTGLTASTDFPTTANALQHRYQSKSTLGSAFVARLNAAGTGLLYATYLGGTNHDVGAGIAVDGAGNAYVTGSTTSSDFPTTANAFHRRCGENGFCTLSHSGCISNCQFWADAFVAELDTSGHAGGKGSLLYGTYLGGSLEDEGRAISIDSRRRVYLTGVTNSLNFPVTGAGQPQHGGANNPFNPNNDAFVAILDLGKAGPGALLFSTYLGGARDDLGSAIARGRAGDIYAAGSTGGGFAGVSSLPYGVSAAFLTRINLGTQYQSLEHNGNVR